MLLLQPDCAITLGLQLHDEEKNVDLCVELTLTLFKMKRVNSEVSQVSISDANWLVLPCISPGVARSGCPSAWSGDLHWLPAGRRWALRASRPSNALSWPWWGEREKIKGAPPKLSLRRHANVPRRSEGFPVPPLLHPLLRQSCGGRRRVEKEEEEEEDRLCFKCVWNR